MDDVLRKRIEGDIGAIDDNALYLLMDAPGGVLAEDFAPLLGAIEDIYRRLLILRLDREVFDNMIRRQSRDEILSGVGRSINSRYAKAVISPDEQITYRREQFEQISIRHYSEGRLATVSEESSEVGRPIIDDTFIPTRVQLARTKMSSPGVLEFIGDPTTLKILVGLLTSLLVLRGQNISRSVSLRGQQTATVRTLIELGYTDDEIKAVRQYLSEDLETLINRLDAARSRIVVGENIDPTEE